MPPFRRWTTTHQRQIIVSDTDADGVDLATFTKEFGTENCTLEPGCLYDLDGNGAVDSDDLDLFNQYFGQDDLRLLFPPSASAPQ